MHRAWYSQSAQPSHFPADLSAIFGTCTPAKTSIAISGTQTKLGPILVASLEFKGRLKIELPPENDDFLFLFTCFGTVHLKSASRAASIPVGHAVAASGGATLEFEEPVAVNLIRVERDTMLRRLAQITDQPMSRAIQFEPAPVPVNHENGASLMPELVEGFSALVQSPLLKAGIGRDPRQESVATIIVDSLIIAYPHNLSADFAQDGQQIAPRHVKRAIEYIHTHPMDTVDPKTLADLGGVSVRALQYAFLATTGKTISEYQRHLRLQRAHDLVRDRPDLSLGAIADMCGFSSLAAFGQSFRKGFGISPSSLRKSGD
ncbi:hypothetical protein BJF93_19130 [Xaviernesmea oryzae]|uniref:HTH araC/xylS-type domain-containing protein n=1 Tax=Xaviernesmea oryzae TaxID=464029 RepID=A0A1Q9B1B0_9HYPH|nr:AraC family transcriptional regulator [Xaviernesmea oryzae]OLP61809.1 hypothetical protein BJF93_19130 [Xaviernesmea oryzae]SEL76710.1 AraC-type DNA-binding protein [Xaviernesmea oryzae]